MSAAAAQSMLIEQLRLPLHQTGDIVQFCVAVLVSCVLALVCDLLLDNIVDIVNMLARF